MLTLLHTQSSAHSVWRTLSLAHKGSLRVRGLSSQALLLKNSAAATLNFELSQDPVDPDLNLILKLPSIHQNNTGWLAEINSARQPDELSQASLL